MTKLHTRRGGFTLIELMIVVAIIGILAAIAIPNFLKFQLRSKTGEAKTNLAAMRTAEEGYFAEYGLYVAAAAQPGGLGPGASKRPWVSPALGFDTVGWGPEGDVYFEYIAILGGPANTAYSLGAQGDLDGGGATSEFAYIKLDPAGVAAADPFGGGCVGGVYNPVTMATDLSSTVGPCSGLDGQDEF